MQSKSQDKNYLGLMREAAHVRDNFHGQHKASVHLIILSLFTAAPLTN